MSVLKNIKAIRRSGNTLIDMDNIKRTGSSVDRQQLLTRIPSAPSEVYTFYSTLKSDPRTSIVITYHQDADTADDIYYRESDSNDVWKIVSPTSVEFQNTTRCINHCEITGLSPNTEYEFTVGHPSYSKTYNKFLTFPNDLTGTLKGAFGSDFQEGSAMWSTMVDLVASQDCRFFTVCGDWVGDDGQLNGSAKWIEFWNDIAPRLKDSQGRIIPLVPVFGNHEAFVGTMARPFFCDMFAFPDEGLKNYGVIDIGNYMSLIVLDDVFYKTNENWLAARPSFETQKVWLDNVLATRTETDYVIPCYHIAFYPSHRPHMFDTVLFDREAYLQSFINNNIRMAFSGHDHTYKKTHEITIDNGVERVVEAGERGIIEFGDGGLGTKYYAGDLHESWYIDDAGAYFSFVNIVTFDTEKATVVTLKSDGTTVNTTEVLK